MSKFAQALQAKQASLQASEGVETEKENLTQVQVPAMAPEQAQLSPVLPQLSLEQPGKTVPVTALKGKRSNAEFFQCNIYLKKETINKAKIVLLQTMDERDFSELMQELLADWLSKQQ